MAALTEQLVRYWAYPFVRYALVVGILVALCASLLGVTLVLRRFSFIGDGLSHVAFGAMSVASVLHLSRNMPLVMAVTVPVSYTHLRAHETTPPWPCSPWAHWRWAIWP